MKKGNTSTNNYIDRSFGKQLMQWGGSARHYSYSGLYLLLFAFFLSISHNPVAPEENTDTSAPEFLSPLAAINPVDPAQGFLVMIEGDAQLVNNENESSIAIGGDLIIDNYNTQSGRGVPEDAGLEPVVNVGFELTTVKEPKFELLQNVPNPFREQTMIGFNVPTAGKVELRIHDAAGRTLKQWSEALPTGYHQFTIQRSDLPASGVLYYTLITGKYTATRKMVVLD